MGGLFKAELVEIAENAFPQLLFKEPAQVTAVQADSLCNGLQGDFFRIMCVKCYTKVVTEVANKIY